MEMSHHSIELIDICYPLLYMRKKVLLYDTHANMYRVLPQYRYIY